MILKHVPESTDEYACENDVKLGPDSKLISNEMADVLAEFLADFRAKYQSAVQHI